VVPVPSDEARCPRCEALPDPVEETGTLHLAPPLGHTGGKLTRALDEEGVAYRRSGDGVVTLELEPGRVRTLDARFRDRLSRRELDSTRAVLTREREPTLRELLHGDSWSGVVARVEGRWLLDVLREDRISTHFQPIVRASDPGDVFGYECLLRGVSPEGDSISPGRMFSVAGEADLLFQLDRAARLQAIRAADEHDLPGRIFINFNPTSIYDPEYCLKTTVAAIREAGIEPGRVVFEVVESEEIRETADLVKILDYYRDRGFRVALDDLGSGYGSLTLLSRLRPDVVKLDMELVRDVDRDEYRAQVTAPFLESARELGVTTVAEGVERPGEWRWLRDHGADCVSGYLFARPAPTPPRPDDDPGSADDDGDRGGAGRTRRGSGGGEPSRGPGHGEA
jgi:EAL domain-containing protein (putative c-di-GMP-specific phosphodiesterase class I)